MKLVVKNKTLKIENGETLISGNVNTYDLEVNYDKTYNDCSFLYVTFVNEDIKKKQLVGPDKVVKIPSEVLESKGNLVVGFFGIYLEDNILKERHVTNTDVLPIIPGGYDENAEETEVLTPTILEKYLAEMKEFYIKSLDEYNTNSNDKLKEYNENTLLKLTEYDNNAKSKTNDFNSNYEAKKNEVDKTAEEVTQNKTDIEEIKKRVSASEQNAKTSETNAKTSELNAQKSAENASQVLTNVTTIQEDINKTKGEIDTAKESVDKSVEEVNGALTEATNQAKESKKQAGIATSKANQTSADRTAVETMKGEVSSIKTSVEQTKVDTEQIKTDTQTIKEETEQAKNETLEAKETVEKSLETERNESDKKYARAIESDEIVVDSFGQVELDEDGYMKDVSIESNLPEITQETRQGYNKVKGFISEGIYNGSVENGVFTSVSLNGYGNARTRFEPLTLEANKTYYASVDCRALNNSYNNAINILLYYLTGENEYGTKRGTVVQSSTITNEYQRTVMQFDIEEEIEVSGFLIQTANATDAVIELANPMISEQNIDYEPYGISPSMDYPSSFRNVVKDIEVLNCHENLLNVVDNIKRKQFHNGLDYEIQDDGSIIINGTVSGYSGIYSYGGFGSTNKVLKFHKGHKYRIYMEAKNTSNQVARAYFGKPNKNDFEVNCFNDGISYKDYTVQEDYMITHFSINGGTTGNVRENLIVKVWIVDITNGVPEVEEYKPYNGYNENIELSEGQFFGTFQGFKNYIGNNSLKGRLKILTLTGQEVWMATESNTFYYTGIADYKRGTELICLCNYFKSQPNVGNSSNVEEGCCSFYSGTGVNRIYLNNSIFEKNVSKLKIWLKEKYDAGTPVQILYVTNEEFKEDLSIENKSKINSLKVYNGVNNISSNCKISFKANRPIDKVIEENNIKERKISDSKYAKALEGKVEDEQFTEIYAENPDVENLILKGSEITQKTRQGYNQYNKDAEVVGMISSVTGALTSSNTSWRSSDYIPIKELVEYLLSWKSSSSFFQVVFAYYNSNKEFISGNSVAKHNIYKTNITTPENASFLRISYSVIVGDTNVNRYEIQLVEGTEEKTYEEYGASPSINHPSEINVTVEQTIDNNQGNIVNSDKLYIFNSSRYIGTKPTYNEAPAFSVEPNTEYAIISNIDFGDAGFLGWKNNVNNGRLTTTKDNQYAKLVRLFNTGDNNQLSFYVGGFLTDTQGVFHTFTDIDDFFEKTEFMIIKSSFIKNGVLPEYRPYQGYTKKVVLPKGKFIGEYESFENYIENNSLKGRLKIIELTGNENILVSSNGNIFRFKPEITPIQNDNPKEKSNKIISTHFSNQIYNNLNNATVENGVEIYNGFIQFRDDSINSVEGWKAKFKELYESGNSVKILYVTAEEFEEDLPEGTVPKIELMDDLNIVSIDNGTFSFDYNKSLVKVLEEKDNKISELEKQVALNGNYELIDEIVSTTEQQTFEFNNLNLEKAIIYVEAAPTSGEESPGELVTYINGMNNPNIGAGAGLNAGKYGRYIIYIEKLTNNLYKFKYNFNINTEKFYAYMSQSREHFRLVEATKITKISIKHWNAPTGVGTKVTLYGVMIPDSEENLVQALNEVTEGNVIEENTIINENIENNEIENV